MDENNKNKRAHAEYKRRKCIGELIEQLGSALPKHLVRKNGRQVDVLEAAIKYAHESQMAAFPAAVSDNDAKYVSKITNLEQYIIDLESRCDRYARLLDNSGICKIPRSEIKNRPNSLITEHQIIQQDIDNEPCLNNNTLQENAENASTSICVGAPVILLVQQRVGGGRRQRAHAPFPSAFKVPVLLPKPSISNDNLNDFVNQQTTTQAEEVNHVLNNEINPVSESHEVFDEQPIVVNIDEEECHIASNTREDVAVETDRFPILTCEMECQTEPILVDVQPKYVDRGASPGIFPADQPPNPTKHVKMNSSLKNVKPQQKKQRTDAISDIVNFVVETPEKGLSNLINIPSNDKASETRSRTNVVCAPSLLKVDDILQSIAGASNSMNQYANASAVTTRTVPYNNKRVTLTKQSSKRTENVDKHSVPVSTSSSSWREFLPNFSQIFPSYCPPSSSSIAISGAKCQPEVVNSSNKRNIFKTGTNVSSFHHGAADFSIESLQNGFETTKTRSSTQSQKSTAVKLSHFPCGSSNSSTNVPNVSTGNVGVGIPYSEMPVFLPCFPHPPTIHENKHKSKRNDAVSLSSMSNPLIPTDGSQEVNLSNSIFDMQGNNAVNCGTFVPPYDHTGQPVNFYNFSTTKTSHASGTSDERITETQPVAWQWTDHGFATQNYSQSHDVIQTSAQKGQNFHIAAMFPEAATPLVNSSTTHLSPSYRWNEPRLTNNHVSGGTSVTAVPSTHHYSVHEPISWAPPQLRSYSNHERTSNSFMPSFNFSQSNSHS